MQGSVRRTVGIVLRWRGQAVGVVVGDTGWGGVSHARVSDEVCVMRWTGKREWGEGCRVWSGRGVFPRLTLAACQVVAGCVGCKD